MLCSKLLTASLVHQVRFLSSVTVAIREGEITWSIERKFYLLVLPCNINEPGTSSINMQICWFLLCSLDYLLHTADYFSRVGVDLSISLVNLELWIEGKDGRGNTTCMHIKVNIIVILAMHTCQFFLRNKNISGLIWFMVCSIYMSILLTCLPFSRLLMIWGLCWPLLFGQFPTDCSFPWSCFGMLLMTYSCLFQF
jgi:hypothetical protein